MSRAWSAVTALVDIARHGHTRPVRLDDIAARQGISGSYLEQLFGTLRRCGILAAERGYGGGYLLALPADKISVADIISALQKPPIARQATTAEGKAIADLRATIALCVTTRLKTITLRDLVDRPEQALSLSREVEVA